MYGFVSYYQRIYIRAVSENYIERWFLFPLLSVAFVGVPFLYGAYRDMREEARLLQNQNEFLTQGYARLELAYSDRRIRIHDLKNHLIALRELAETGESEKISRYIQQMFHELQKSGALLRSGHPMLDVILSVKEREAEAAGIEFSADCDDLSDMDLSDMAVCALFSNLLDNAIEANGKSGITEKRWIRMMCRRVGEMLCVTVENPVFESVNLEDGTPVTTKKEGDHGLGMKSIRRVTEEHGGFLNIQTEGDTFSIAVALHAFFGEKKECDSRIEM